MLLYTAYAFLFMIFFLPFGIKLIKSLQFKQTVRAEGPKSHAHKTGTPTMGGFWFLVPLVGFLFFSEHLTATTRFIVLAGLFYGLIGFADDFIKVIRKRNLGLTSKQKLLCQLVAGAVLYTYMIPLNLSTNIEILSMSLDLKWAYPAFVVLLFVATSNASNLTDGLDGLLSGISIPIFFTFALIGLEIQDTSLSFLACLWIGVLAGFLVFNFHPAKVFMGDVGSLAIGGTVAAFAIATKTELLLVLIGGVFVIETLSVILQVLYFKQTSKRLFKMTPIHHSFEMSGWNEKQIALSFWLTSILFASIGFLIFIT
ncbi:phospho-N-acetylmuramoyl-pentapeptide-transferase [Bacillus cereus]|uniref:Phospho-N-acetylmuramoyl-pentapeptide-transferase n=1 Tax=Bacillus cereus TaxID=1396 RepID=A0A162PHC4_BACCE|nr:phospho-N-acetylmuramoyl-pentapeptide-transferase [Bacillus cereus]KZD71999.1 Phospho-N-acetylmuramoyl-pentapeptide- transferase [Bacillus cereus]